MDEILKIIERLEPVDALAEIARVSRKLLSHVDEEAKYDFVVKLIGDNNDSKLGNLVHL